MLAKRIIPCLDVKDGVVVKGVKFRGHEVVGEIVPLAKRYAEEGADELVFYDITASSDGRVVDKSWISRVAEAIDIPFCVAGGIRTVEDAGRLLAYGADKISVNSPALADPDLISRLADRFGVQCVVVGIDSRHEEGSDEYRVNQFTGDEKKTRVTQWSTLDWVEEVQKRGAGEIVLTGIEVASWGRDLQDGSTFADLVERRRGRARPLPRGLPRREGRRSACRLRLPQEDHQHRRPEELSPREQH